MQLYQFLGDNVDLIQYVSHESIGRKTQDHHWFPLMALKYRVVSGGEILSRHYEAAIADLAISP